MSAVFGVGLTWSALSAEEQVMVDAAMEREGVVGLPERGAGILTWHGNGLVTGHVAVFSGRLHIGVCALGKLDEGTAWVTMHEWGELQKWLSALERKRLGEWTAERQTG